MHAQTVDTRPFSSIFRMGLGTRLAAGWVVALLALKLLAVG